MIVNSELTHIRTMSWALLVLVVATLFAVPPSAGTARASGCTSTRPAVQAKQTPPAPAPAASRRHGYLVEVRMGWAV